MCRPSTKPSGSARGRLAWLGRAALTGWALLTAPGARAQIDPTERQLIQIGISQPLEGRSTIPGYAYYYYNQPSFICSNLTLRLAVAPVYLDSELGIAQALGPNTDLGLGLAGGGFADSYYAFKAGNYSPGESFTGEGANVSLNLYHLFNPGSLIPLNGVLRGEASQAVYLRNDNTAANFVLPKDQTTFKVRTGLRWGGKEPLLVPELAMELSAWYEGEFRLDPGAYGFAGDRSMQPASHLFWGRALLAYTLPESRHNFLLSFTAGTSADVDRFSAYRLGGVLPLASEFPLTMPGYYYQEFSANRFALINLTYNFPLDERKRWALTMVATTAYVDYLPGTEQPGSWDSGMGGGITYRSSSKSWQVFAGYSYAFQALRDGRHGGESIGLLVQFDLGRTKSDLYSPGGNNGFLRGLDGFLHSFQ